MNQAPEISIITPVYNGLPYVKECIESVLAQDFQQWELLISDNGSSDGTRAYLSSLEDPRIRVFYQDENLGIMGNLNFIFTKAMAPISQILCADDYFTTPRALNMLMDYWTTASNAVGFVRFNHQEPSAGSTEIFQKEITPSVLNPDTAKLWFFIFGNIPGNLSNVSLRTNIVKEAGWFDQKFPFAGDFEFWIRASNLYAMGVQNEMLVYVRRHDKVASNVLSLRGELYQQHLAIYESLIKSLSSIYQKKDLITYFNFEICSFHYRNGLKAAIKGDFRYLKRFISTSSSANWPKIIQIVACLPFALFEKERIKVTCKMARNFINQNQSALKSQLAVH
jgi:glycosyltransferase involved in cell wall biosynthesis